jgi:hypothetical protein
VAWRAAHKKNHQSDLAAMSENSARLPITRCCPAHSMTKKFRCGSHCAQAANANITRHNQPVILHCLFLFLRGFPDRERRALYPRDFFNIEAQCTIKNGKSSQLVPC